MNFIKMLKKLILNRQKNVNWEDTYNHKMSMDTESVKQVLRKLILDGQKISAWWDTGGDDTPVGIFVKDNEFEFNSDIREVFDYLRMKIIDSLELPGAGQYYHEGEGKIYLNEEESVILQFSSKEHGYDIWGEEDEIEEKDDREEAQNRVLKTIYIDDYFGITKHLYRLEINLEGEFDEDFNKLTALDVNVINGDNFDFNDEIQNYYRSQVNTVLDNLILEFKQKNLKFVGIHIEGILQPDHSVKFQLTADNSGILQIHNEEKVLLIE